MIEPRTFTVIRRNDGLYMATHLNQAQEVRYHWVKHPLDANSDGYRQGEFMAHGLEDTVVGLAWFYQLVTFTLFCEEENDATEVLPVSRRDDGPVPGVRGDGEG